MHVPNSAEASAWIAESTSPWERLVTLGPEGYERYARLRFVPDPQHPGQHEADVSLPADHLDDGVQTRLALRVLTRHTATPERIYWCVWEGADSCTPALPAAPLSVAVPNRRYRLYESELTELEQLLEPAGGPKEPPAFVWPADRAWCIACDVDSHWAGVGGTRSAIEDLLDVSALDVVPADYAMQQPAYRQ